MTTHSQWKSDLVATVTAGMLSFCQPEKMAIWIIVGVDVNDDVDTEFTAD